MPTYDESQRQIVLRIAYDGAGTAGKTTNLQQLVKVFTTTRRGEMVTPQVSRGRTLFFDWLPLEGGLVGGHRFRCELLTVPGQASLRQRRLHILRTADVVVLVVDSRPDGVLEAQEILRELREDIPGTPPVVLQTNKQDLEGACSPEVVRSALRLHDVPTVAACASEGDGVRETVVLAMRQCAAVAQAALERAGVSSFETSQDTPEQMLAELENLKLLSDDDDDDVSLQSAVTEAIEKRAPERDDAGHRPPVARTPTEAPATERLNAEDGPRPGADDGTDDEATGTVDGPATRPLTEGDPPQPHGSASAARSDAPQEPEGAHTGGDRPTTVPPRQPARTSSSPRLRVEPAAASEPGPSRRVEGRSAGAARSGDTLRPPGKSLQPTAMADSRPERRDAPEHAFPTPDVSSRHIWPARQGRTLLRSIPFAEAQLRRDLVHQQGKADGSAKDDTVIYQCGGYCLKTSHGRRYTNQEDAERALLHLARAKSSIGSLLPPETCVALQRDDDAGFWLWTVAPWYPSLRHEMHVAESSRDHRALSEALHAYVRGSLAALRLLLENEILLDINPANFARNDQEIHYLDDDILAATSAPGIGHAWLRRVDEYGEAIDSVESYLNFLETQLATRLSADDARRLDLYDSISDTIVQTDAARQARHRLLTCLSQCA